MAGKSTDTRHTIEGLFAAAGNSRLDDATYVAGLAGAFGEAAKLGPQVLALQQALLAGMVQSRRREAERRSKQNKDDPRAAAAAQKANQLAELQALAEGRIGDVGNFADALQRGRILHGYVAQPDGTPAEMHVVQVDVRDAASKKSRRGRAKTDADGYFRIDLGGSDQGGGILRVLDQLARAVPDDAAGTEAAPVPAASAAEAAPPPDNAVHEADPPSAGAPPAAPSGDATSSGAAAPASASAVQVLDPNGQVVLEDPLPPRFAGGNSEFRYYVLAEKSAAAPSRRRGKKDTKDTKDAKSTSETPDIGDGGEP